MGRSGFGHLAGTGWVAKWQQRRANCSPHPRDRADGWFRWPTGKELHPQVVRSALAQSPAIIGYQVRQTARNTDVTIASGNLVGVIEAQIALATGLHQWRGDDCEGMRGGAMSVLIIVGPKHGSAREIAIAGHLNASGHHATAADAEAPPGDLDQFDASVIGSAIYMAHWTKQARRFIDEHTTQLAARSEWLFSGGLR